MSEEIRPRGRYWQELPTGTRVVTSRRTVTETDLITVITWAGINEPLFTDAAHARTMGYADRLVPGVLTYVMAEGLVVQTGVFHDTGMAFMGAELTSKGPVFVGDTVHAEVEITESRPSRDPARGVVTSRVDVFADRSGLVLTYTPVRLVRSQP